MSRRAAAACATLAVAAIAASARAATPPAARACPSASVVSAALEVKVKVPTSTTAGSAKSCSYSTGTLIPVKVGFRADTSATFAAGEKGAGKLIPLLVIHGLGASAWATKAPGELQVFDGHGTTITIQAPLVANVDLEALARKLL
ncbi:MAG TPA: hypothetical protein VH063_11145 [Gaiellaceae bacterium]|jgi:hypothetical protein|nr:hypothetical protein [Gaiellaceae bacterium]